MSDINTVCVAGGITQAPELRQTASGTSVLGIRLANSRRRSDGNGGYTDRSNYFDVTIFGKRADALAQILSRGMQIVVTGEMSWREWETPEGQKRQAIEILADEVQLPPRSGNPEGQPGATVARAAQPVTAGVGATGADLDEDIPF